MAFGFESVLEGVGQAFGKQMSSMFGKIMAADVQAARASEQLARQNLAAAEAAKQATDAMLLLKETALASARLRQAAGMASQTDVMSAEAARARAAAGVAAATARVGAAEAGAASAAGATASASSMTALAAVAAPAAVALGAVVVGGMAVKGAFDTVANAGASLATAIAPFTAEVGRFNPGTIDRMNLAFDNLSAATGKIWEPIVTAATGFADELNQAFTAIGPPIRAVVEQFAGLATSVGREVFAGLFEIVQAGVPIISGFIDDLRPFAPMARELFKGLVDVTKGFMQVAGVIAHEVMAFMAPVVEALRPLVAVAREGFRIMGVLWDTVKELLRPFAFLIPTTGNLVSVVDGAVSALQTFTAAVGATARMLREQVENPLVAANPQLLVQGWLLDFQNIQHHLRQQIQPRPPFQLPGGQGMTLSSQPARHVGIEDVGLEARRQAFSQGRDVQELILQWQQRAANALLENLPEIVRALQEMRLNFPPIGLN